MIISKTTKVFCMQGLWGNLINGYVNYQVNYQRDEKRKALLGLQVPGTLASRGATYEAK